MLRRRQLRIELCCRRKRDKEMWMKEWPLHKKEKSIEEESDEKDRREWTWMRDDKRKEQDERENVDGNREGKRWKWKTSCWLLRC